MILTPGSILISNTTMHGDPTFDRAVIIVAEHNEKGALGFIINKPFHRKFNELVEFKNSIAFPLWMGGPVKKEELFFLHQRPDLVANGKPVTGNVYFGGNFQQAVQYMNDKTLKGNDVKLFIGYCGWDDHELEDEIAEGTWIPVDTPLQTVFSTDTEYLWTLLYQSLKVPS
ncbi:MAG: YqgE/AlgH family protein [Bacteroidota bacterium]|nr:YqgE/AlgH family protein [Bacteroidota bacterium]